MEYRHYQNTGQPNILLLNRASKKQTIPPVTNSFTVKITPYYLNSSLNLSHPYISGSTMPTILAVIAVCLSINKKRI